MEHTSARPADYMEQMLGCYGNMLYRLCLVTLGNESDAEDAVQETFMKLLQKAPEFVNQDHEKAWLITVASNKCKDILRFRTRHPLWEPEKEMVSEKKEEDSGILDALMTLPETFRTVLVLYYVEECSIETIAKVIGRTSSAVKMRLQKGRKLLAEAYRKGYM